MNLLYQPAWAILVKLGEINMIPLIILNKTQSVITGIQPSLTGEVVGWSSFKTVLNCTSLHQRWPPLLIIEIFLSVITG
jgi:hypothetical protein